MRALILITMIHLLFPMAAKSEVLDPQYDELEGLPLVEKLLENNHLTLAEEELKSLMAMAQNHEMAVRLKAQLLYKQKKYSEVIDWVKASPSSGTQSSDSVEKSSLHRWAALALEQSGDKEKALRYWRQVVNGHLKPEQLQEKAQHLLLHQAWGDLLPCLDELLKQPLDFARQMLILESQIAMDLEQEAYQRALTWLNHRPEKASAFLQTAELFSKSQNPLLAEKILLLGSTRFPQDGSLHLALAQIHFHRGELFLTSESFARASGGDAEYHRHSSELFLQTDQVIRSLFHKQLIPGDTRSLQQSLSRHLKQKNYAAIVALQSSLLQTDLARDEEVLYALAFSLGQMGQRKQALITIEKIRKPHLLAKASQLQQALHLCEQDGKNCL